MAGVVRGGKVAMESTSVYWIPVYEPLERAGFEVMLVPPRMTKQIGGRKSDVLDCQWIWQLMSYGLLRGAFRPGDEVSGERLQQLYLGGAIARERRLLFRFMSLRRPVRTAFASERSRRSTFRTSLGNIGEHQGLGKNSCGQRGACGTPGGPQRTRTWYPARRMRAYRNAVPDR